MIVYLAKPIPDRQQVRVIAVGFGLVAGMMHLVHVWRDEDEAQPAIEPLRQTDIGTDHAAIPSLQNEYSFFIKNTDNRQAPAALRDAVAYAVAR
jgi:hypothetical protein